MLTTTEAAFAVMALTVFAVAVMLLINQPKDSYYCEYKNEKNRNRKLVAENKQLKREIRDMKEEEEC